MAGILANRVVRDSCENLQDRRAQPVCRAREVSVVLVVVFGMRYLKEPFGGPRLLACGLVLLGMLLMKLKL